MTWSNGNISALLSLCARNSPVTGEFPSQGPVTRSFVVNLISAWINSWVIIREAGDLRRRRAYYDVMVIKWTMITLRHVKAVLSYWNRVYLNHIEVFLRSVLWTYGHHKNGHHKNKDLVCSRNVCSIKYLRRNKNPNNPSRDVYNYSYIHVGKIIQCFQLGHQLIIELKMVKGAR